MKMRKIETAFFKPDTRRELASSLPDSMRVNGLDQFIDATEFATERVNANCMKESACKEESPLAVRTRFQEIEKAVIALQREMRGLTDKRYKTLAAAAMLETKNMGSARDFLLRMRGELDTLQKWCSTVVTHIEPDRTDKTSKRWALWLTIQVATAYRDLYGEVPPTGGASWFLDFMARVGQLAGVTVGRVIVAQAVKALRAQHV